MEIVINKNKTYEYAMALTAHTGKSIGQYESVAITKDNYPLLDTYMSSAITSVEAVLRPLQNPAWIVLARDGR